MKIGQPVPIRNFHFLGEEADDAGDLLDQLRQPLADGCLESGSGLGESSEAGPDDVLLGLRVVAPHLVTSRHLAMEPGTSLWRKLSKADPTRKVCGKIKNTFE